LLHSNEKRTKSLKIIEIQLVESFKKYSGIPPFLMGSWIRKKKVLTNWIIAKTVKISYNEYRKFDFKLKLPNTWAPKILKFMVKIGSKFIRLSKCVLPVYNSSRPPSYTPTMSIASYGEPIQNQSVANQKKPINIYDERFETKVCKLCGESIRKQASYCEFCGTKQE
jgi:hypothetical protein